MKKSLISLFCCTIFAVGVSAQTTNPNPYCLPAFDATNNSGSAQNFIAEVKLVGGTLDNVTTLFGSSSYVYYNNLPTTTIHEGVGDLLQLQLIIASGSANVYVYIDYDHNNVFDAVEQVFFNSGISGAGSIGAPLPLPSTALYGYTRMRIQWMQGTTFGPCQPTPSNDFGEIEDYDVSITGTFPIATTTHATSLNPTNATLNGLINANYSTASADSFEYGTTTAYGNKVATASVWALTDSTVKTVVSGLTPATTYHYRVMGTNANGTNYGRDTTFTTPLTTAVSSLVSDLKLNIYPNPAKDMLHIDIDQAATYKIQNVLGATMKTGSLQEGNNIIAINELPLGNYILEVNNEKGVRNISKFVK